MKGFPLAVMVGFSSLLLGTMMNILVSRSAKKLEFKKHSTFNQNPKTHLGSSFATFLTHLGLFNMCFCYAFMTKMKSPSEFNQFPAAWTIHIYYTIGPFFLVFSQFLYFFAANSHMRRAIMYCYYN